MFLSDSLRQSNIQRTLNQSQDVGDGRFFLALTGFPYILVYDAATQPPLILRVGRCPNDRASSCAPWHRTTALRRKHFP